MIDSMNDITQLLRRVREGDDSALEALSTVIYDELYAMANRLCNHASDSLHPSMLVNEAFARLLRSGSIHAAENRRYLFGACAKSMREIIADYIKHRDAAKRQANGDRISLDAIVHYFESQDVSFLDLHDALEQLAILDQRKADIIQWRFFLGMSMPEIAAELGVSMSTVESDWRMARAWLFRRLGPDAQHGS